ncbi:LAME_0E08988g1_1 [Lachancea meyersii CBS 8951]|uniref:LAME_0E08988g1_1 n=1 Tax=Lachancea meyersii CBS 8951 TaxID=1266667 RepID=A0A1G4JJE2_9SACH|nr:LAME_0E08988g1_1 [Lachancea meyersii CBS 8951]
MAHNESRKRTRPCALCKKNKVKCHYVNSLPCERCLKYGLKCQFEEQNTSVYPTGYTSSPHPVQTASKILPQPAITDVSHFVPPSDPRSVASRLNTLESALESVLSILQTSQSQQQQQAALIQQHIGQHPWWEKLRPLDVEEPGVVEPAREVNTNQESCQDLHLHKILTLTEVEELFELFSAKFAPQLFGYVLGTLDVSSLWHSSSFLLQSICTVTCLHHPLMVSKFSLLKRCFESSASRCLMTEVPAVQIEHTILALVIGALWLESGQMFISVAIQLARVHKLDQPSSISSSFRSPSLHRLWYLLYIVDGNQNLTLHKSPSIYKGSEPILQKSRDDVIASFPSPSVRKVLNANYQAHGKVVNNRQLELLNEVECRKLTVSGTSLSELRLLGQLEYHMAMESIFTNDKRYAPDANPSLEASISLLDPSKFGMHWESNLELDKWMISWTITLQNIDFQSDPWCLKSTLLYYNFARMHINTKALFAGGKAQLFNLGTTSLVDLWHSPTSNPSTDLEKAMDASYEISHSAAQSLIRLATEDNDIREIFQFLPMHVHAMLFYASLVLLNPEDPLANGPRSDRKILTGRYKTVNNLRTLLYRIPLSDSNFRKRILDTLDQLLERFAEKCLAVGTANAEDANRVRCHEIFESDDLSDHESKLRPIVAWPGTNPGHP